MPLIKSAIKKLRKDKKRTVRNKAIKSRYKELLKKALADPTTDSINRVISAVDKAAKRRVIHPNRAARLKSRAMKSLGKKTPTFSSKAKKKTVKATIKKKSKEGKTAKIDTKEGKK